MNIERYIVTTEAIEVDVEAIVASVDTTGIAVPQVGTWEHKKYLVTFGDHPIYCLNEKEYTKTFVTIPPSDLPRDTLVDVTVAMSGVASGSVTFAMASGFVYRGGISLPSDQDARGWCGHVGVAGDYQIRMLHNGQDAGHRQTPDEIAPAVLVGDTEPLREIATRIAEQVFVGIDAERYGEREY